MGRWVPGLAAVVLLAAVDGVVRAEAVGPRRLVEVVDLSGPVVSPDGRRVAFRAERAWVERNTYGSAWYVQDMDGRTPPHEVGDGGVPLRDSAGGAYPAEAVWSADGRFVFYRALLDGRVDVWRAAADGSGAQAMTHDAADVRAFSLEDDGRTLRYSTGATRDEVVRAEQAEYDRGIHIDESVPVGAGLFRSSFVGGRLATQRYTGIWFDRGPMLGSAPDRWHEIDLATGRRRDPAQADKAAPKPGTVDAAALPLTLFEAREPRGERVAVLTRADGGDRTKRSNRAVLSILPRKGSRNANVCSAPLCSDKDISSVQWRPGGQEVLFTVTDRAAGEVQSVFRWDIATGEVWPVVAAGGFINGGREASSTCGVSATALACVTAEANRPPRLESIAIADGERRVLSDPNAALAADLEASVSSRMLAWTDADGRRFTGQLFERRAGPPGRRPLFVNYYHCMGFLRGGVGDEWPLASLAAAGISTLCINAPPLVADPVLRFDGALGAVRGAIDLLAHEGVVDPARVGMGGLSFGSEVALWVAMHSDMLRAVSVTSPSVTPLYYLMNSTKGDMFASGLRTVWGLGTPDETPAQWQRLSPTYNVARIRAPVLFQMPEEEYLYALDYVVPLMRKRQADLYVFPHEPHRKFQPRHMLAAYERNLDWFRFWLQGVEDADAGKAGQYAHWREMREAIDAGRAARAGPDQD